jgi:hypothetical protein
MPRRNATIKTSCSPKYVCIPNVTTNLRTLVLLKTARTRVCSMLSTSPVDDVKPLGHGPHPPITPLVDLMDLDQDEMGHETFLSSFLRFAWSLGHVWSITTCPFPHSWDAWNFKLGTLTIELHPVIQPKLPTSL